MIGCSWKGPSFYHLCFISFTHKNQFFHRDFLSNLDFFFIVLHQRRREGGVGGVSPSTFFTCRHFVAISANFIGKFHRGPSHGKKIKILWRRKCVRKMIFRNVEVRIEGRFVPFNPYFDYNTAIGALCDDFYRKSYDFTIKNR